MNWYILTSNNSRHIIPAFEYLFAKYVRFNTFKSIKLNYIDLTNEPVDRWSLNVAEKLPDDEYLILGLDDFLIIENINWQSLKQAITLAKTLNYNRFELSWGASKKESWIKDNPRAQFEQNGNIIRFGPETPYSVSCQFSIWKTSALKKILTSKPMTPWEFETQTRLDNVYCHTSEHCVLRYIEESAISSRQKGKINVLGLSNFDLYTLLHLGKLNEEDLIYGWKGDKHFKVELAGEKYRKFYNR